jgi:hypothetical protein
MALSFRDIVQELKNAKKSSDETVIIECAERVEKLRCRLAAIPPRRQGTTGVSPVDPVAGSVPRGWSWSTF